MLLLCTNVVTAMEITPDQLRDKIRSEYIIALPPELVQAAEFASEKKIDDAIEALKKFFKIFYKNNQISDTDTKKIYTDLESAHKFLCEEFISKKDSLESSFTIENYIYRGFMEYFWWQYYYPIHEGLVDEDLINEDLISKKLYRKIIS
jgi:hypothetical protein